MSEAPVAREAPALANTLLNQGVDGAGPLSSSRELAAQYAQDPSYASTEARVDALIRWEAAKNFGASMLSGLGGVITLPVALPAWLWASWVLQARLVGAVAELYGHPSSNDRVRTLILLCLLGDAGRSALKEAGVQVGQHFARGALSNVSAAALGQINRMVGIRLLTKAGEAGVINLAAAVPLAGGLVGGLIDGSAALAVGEAAQRLFAPADDDDGPPIG